MYVQLSPKKYLWGFSTVEWKIFAMNIFNALEELLIVLHWQHCVALGCQTSLPKDEWSEFLWTVHGGAGHLAWETSVWAGHRWVCQPTQEVSSVEVRVQTK